MKARRMLTRTLALCLTLLMAIGLFSTAALAIGNTDKGSIEVSGVENGVKVSAYKLMDVAYDYTVDQPVQPVYTWTDAVADWVREHYSNYIGQTGDNSVQPAFSQADTNAIATFYDQLAAGIKGGTPSVTVAGTCTGEGTIANLDMGNYLILIENGLRVYRPSAVNLVPQWNAESNAWEMTTPAKVEVKSSEMSITKTVRADGTDVGQPADNASIGDTVTFDITADIPQFPANATAKNYVISDTLPAGLTLTNGSIQVYGVSAEGQENLLTNNGTTYYSQGAQRPEGVGGAVTSFTLTFMYEQISSYNKIHITYTATLNGDAALALGTSGNENSAVLDYSNNPYDSSSWQTQTDKATVYTYGLDISKVDAKNTSTFLSGAEFALYASDTDAEEGQNAIEFVYVSDGVYRKATADEDNTTTTLVVGSQEGLVGKLTLQGLDAGTWYLVETKAPGGYNKLAAPVSVTIVDDNVDGSVTDEQGNEHKNGLLPLMVKNDSGFQLPTTGGMGTVLFTAVGVVLMGAAVILFIFVRRRKTTAND